jgi:hypothetical protein
VGLVARRALGPIRRELVAGALTRFVRDHGREPDAGELRDAIDALVGDVAAELAKEPPPLGSFALILLGRANDS